MERHRGERFDNYDETYHNKQFRMPPRSSESPMSHNHRSSNYRGGFSGGGRHDNHNQRHSFNSPPNHLRGVGGFDSGHSMPLSGQKRGFPFSGQGGSPDNADGGGSFTKLFIGSVPRTVTEEDIRPLFEEHGNVIEVALIKDRRTGQQQGCCFVKYGTLEEADRAIKALHNQYTLPGGAGPIQVRFADGERERLGSVEDKLFVGSLNRQATEKEIEEIFSPYGRVEDVYIMRDDLKQSRGCGFVKFSHRDMALAAMNALNGTYLMRGCDQPLIVRFADPKRPRGGESRGGPSFGGPGFGPRLQPPFGVRPTTNFSDPMGGRIPGSTWHPMIPQNIEPSSEGSLHGLEGHLVGRSGFAARSPTAGGSLGVPSGPINGSRPGQQSFNPSMSQIQYTGQQISPLQKSIQSPQHMPPSLSQPHPQHSPVSFSQTHTSQASTLQVGHMQPHPQQTPVSFSQTHASYASTQQVSHLQIPHSTTQLPSSQAPPPQLHGFSGQLSVSQPQFQQSTSSNVGKQIPSSLQQPPVSSVPNQQLLQPLQKPPTQLTQMLSQQTQALQASFQSSQQEFSRMQQQMHVIQPSSQDQTQQQSMQPTKQQTSWSGIVPQTSASTPVTAPAALTSSTVSAAPIVPISAPKTAPLTCNWTEHTSPEGYKYYYNSVTSESRWEKPEEFTLFEQQQQQKQLLQQQQSPLQQLQSQTQNQTQRHVLSSQHVSQAQQVQLQTQLGHQPHMQLQQPYQASGVSGHQNVQELGYAQQVQAATGSAIDTARFQQGPQAAQEWMWKNKPAGA